MLLLVSSSPNNIFRLLFCIVVVLLQICFRVSLVYFICIECVCVSALQSGWPTIYANGCCLLVCYYSCPLIYGCQLTYTHIRKVNDKKKKSSQMQHLHSLLSSFHTLTRTHKHTHERAHTHTIHIASNCDTLKMIPNCALNCLTHALYTRLDRI